jgi:hypothetical protein
MKIGISLVNLTSVCWLMAVISLPGTAEQQEKGTVQRMLLWHVMNMAGEEEVLEAHALLAQSDSSPSPLNSINSGI